MMRADFDSRRGFTLVELLIGLGVSALVILSAVALMVSQQRAFRNSSDDRGLQEIGRIALSRLSADLRTAGFGVDPAVAFDFGPMSNVRLALSPKGQSIAAGGFRCDAGPGCRDRTDGSDEIVFLARDPLFAKPLRAAVTASSTQLTIAGPLSVPLRQGQILQVMCYTAPMAWAYLTVASDVAVSANTSVNVPIEAGSGYDFPHQNQALGDACFSVNMGVNDPPYAPDDAGLAAAAKVFKVDRFRYFVQNYGGRPYLMLDHGGPDNAPQLEVIAPDVEDLQFAYVFPNALATPLVGATAGTAITNDGNGIELAPTEYPAYGDALTANAQTNHQAGNIRAVKVSVVVRSAAPNPNHPLDSTIPAAANRGALTGDAGYQRLLIETTVGLPNMSARAPYFPFYGKTTDALNVGGG